MSEKMVLRDYLTLQGTLTCLTGLRIGTSTDIIEIGGMDNPIIKHPLSGLPYIPGSSLKGKMRALLELRHDKVDARPYELNQKTGKVQKNRKGDSRKNRDYGDAHRAGGYNCDGENCFICRLFGTTHYDNRGEETEAKNIGPSRLIMRDANLTEEARNNLKDKLLKGEAITEVKYENTINRITARANPRSVERVPAGTSFSFEIGYRIFDTGDDGATDYALFKHIAEGLTLLKVDTLGGSGSRGYGKISFDDLTLINLAGETLLEKGSLKALIDLQLSQ